MLLSNDDGENCTNAQDAQDNDHSSTPNWVEVGSRGWGDRDNDDRSEEAGRVNRNDMRQEGNNGPNEGRDIANVS